MIKALWFKISDKIRFLLVGTFNTGCSYVVYSLLCFLLGERFYQHSLLISWVLTSLTGFFLYKFLVFESKETWWKEYFKCCATWSVSYFVNAATLELLVKLLKTNVYISQIIACCFSAVTTYVLFKIYAFKKGRKNGK